MPSGDHITLSALFFLILANTTDSRGLRVIWYTTAIILGLMSGLLNVAAAFFRPGTFG